MTIDLGVDRAIALERVCIETACTCRQTHTYIQIWPHIDIHTERCFFIYHTEEFKTRINSIMIHKSAQYVSSD